MSVKTDPSGRRWIQVEVEVPGTPEEIWQAIATGPGISSWFIPTEVDEKQGLMNLNFGEGMVVTAKITAWDPPRRFAAESPLPVPDAPPFATEWIVEARSGGTCIVRVVHSLFASTDAWDDQLEGPESGWPAFFRILKLYLKHFRGLPCSTFHVMGSGTESVDKTWRSLMDSLGLSKAVVGQACKTNPGTPPLSGQVERFNNEKVHELLIHVDQPAPGIISIGAFEMGGQACAIFHFHFYGDHAGSVAAQAEPAWKTWMNQQLPPGGESA